MPRKKKKHLVLHREWCKGCSICVEFCPAHVLALDALEKISVVDEGACTECRLCELRCPDFAIELVPLPPQAEEAQ
jgi:2-oxoglutarate ferredoxin oxidoreductase subunit delta